MVTVVSWSLSSTSSSTPVTAIVWAFDQLAVVNVNVDDATVASPVSADVTDNTTLEVGSVSSTTVNESVDPASVTEAVVLDRVYPAVSSSTVVTDTVESATSSKPSSLFASSTATVTVVA